MPRWSKEQLQWLSENYHDSGLRVSEIASRLGHTVGGVMIKARKIGVFKKWHDHEKETLTRLWNNPAVNVNEICKRLKRDRESVMREAYTLGLRRPSRGNVSVHWTESDIEIVKSMQDRPMADVLEALPNHSEKQISNLSRRIGLKPRPYGVRFADKANRSRERARLIVSGATCFVHGCIEWNDVLEVHHEKNDAVFVLCPGHHSRITRRKAKIESGKYVLL